MSEPFLEVMFLVITINWLLMIVSLIACTIRGAKGQQEIGPITLWLIRGSLYFAFAAIAVLVVALFAEPITNMGDVLGLGLLVAPSLIGIPLWSYYLRHCKPMREKFPTIGEEETGA
jgi:hypothetical protein